jgi:hypothetical protein
MLEHAEHACDCWIVERVADRSEYAAHRASCSGRWDMSVRFQR